MAKTLKQVITGFPWWNYGLDGFGLQSDAWAQDLAKAIEDHFGWRLYPDTSTPEAAAKAKNWGDGLLAEHTRALTSAQRLLPDGGTRTQEFGAATQTVPIKYTVSSFTLEAAADEAARTDGFIVERTVTIWPDGSAYIGPWTVYTAHNPVITTKGTSQ